MVASNDDFIGLTTGTAIPAGPLTIEVSYSGKIDREKSQGIYAVQEGDEWYAYTFFEPIDGRRAFPGFDQPDAKVPWQLTFHVKQDHVALANAPVESETPEPDGMKKVVIAESKPMPSYLVAFVVGAFELADGGTAGRVRTPIRFIIPKGRRRRAALRARRSRRAWSPPSRTTSTWTTRTASSTSRWCRASGARWSTRASWPWASRSR